MSLVSTGEEQKIVEDGGNLVGPEQVEGLEDCITTGGGVGGSFDGCVADFLDVTCFGAKGDGLNDDTQAITDAVEKAHEDGKMVYFPAGDYVVTDVLPFYSNMLWLGEGQPGSVQITPRVIETEDLGAEWRVKFEDGANINHRSYDGDPITFFDFNDDSNNGLYSISEVRPDTNELIINNPGGTTVADPNADAFAEVVWKGKGSTLRHKDLDGNTYTHGRFIDARGIRNSGIEGMGFMGAGINEVFGGGIRLRRPEDPDFSATALSGLKFDDILIEHIPNDGLVIGQTIFSSFRDMRFERCVGDGFRLAPEDGIGGATTSCLFDTLFFRGCRRGLATEIFVYCTMNNCVAEGCSIGYYLERAIGCTFNSPASETIKFERAGKDNGVTIRMVESYSNVVNGLTVYYNTNLDEWTKGAIEIIDPAQRGESQVADLNHAHIHESAQERQLCVGTEWDGTNDEILWYLDVSNTPAYRSPDSDDNTGSWLSNSFINVGDMVMGIDVQRDDLFSLPNRYRIKEINRFNFVTSNATVNSSAPTQGNDIDDGFVNFSTTDGLWIDDTASPAEAGYYVCVDDTTGAAQWLEWSKLWYYVADSRGHNRSYAPAPASEDPQAYTLSIGRKYGADVITEQTFRCLETGVDANGNLEVWLDVQDFQPTNYLTNTNYDPFQQNSTRSYTIQDNHRIETINSEDYWVIGLIVPSGIIPDGFNWSNTWEDKNVYTAFSENGISISLDVAYVYEDESSESLLLAIDTDEIVQQGNEIEVFNPRLANMEGVYNTHPTAPQWDISNVSPDHAAIKLTLSANLETTITRHIDDALLRVEGFTAAPISEVNLKGYDIPIVYDPDDVIYPGGGRQFEVEFSSSAATTGFDMRMVDMYNFKPFIEDSFTLVRTQSKDVDRVTFERDSTGTVETATVRAVRKKSPGFEDIWRDNPATGGEFSPD